MTLLVDMDDTRVLADVGFGADGLLLPVSLDGAESRQYGWTYRVVADGGVQVLQTRSAEAWEHLYAFTPEPQLPVDYEIANHFTSTHPGSRFVQALTAQRLSTDVRRILRNRDYSEDRGVGATTRTLADDDELLAVLATEFGLVFPAGTRFAYDRGDG